MPTDPIGTATVYNNYGNLLLRQFRYDDALPKYVCALDILNRLGAAEQLHPCIALHVVCPPPADKNLSR